MGKMFAALIATSFLFLPRFENISSAQEVPLQAKVLVLKGEARFNDQELKEGAVIRGKGKLQSGARSYMKFYVERWDHTIVLGSSAEMDLDLGEIRASGENYELTKGACRWLSGSAKHKISEDRYHVHTKTASLGVRGTDFWIHFNPDLNETEIVVFDGKVKLRSDLNPSDAKLVSKGQWGGVGGRFGKKIGPLLNLEKSFLEKLSNQVPID